MFKKLLMDNLRSPVNMKKIKAIETKINVVFPEDYKKWLLKYNGGISKLEDTFDFMDSDACSQDYNTARLDNFKAFNGEDYDDLYSSYLTFQGRIPDEMIAIADAVCGNQICLGIKGKYYGKVYFWDHENESPNSKDPSNPDGKAWYENIYLIANSFTDFINKLYRYEIDDEETAKHGDFVFKKYPPSADFSETEP